MRGDVPSLRTVAIVHEIERTFAASCDRQDFRLVHYSLQGNHAHLIVEATDRDALGRGMKAIGARLARAVNRVTGRSGKVLADRYHHHLLSTPREVHRALRYVLLNARRHSKHAHGGAMHTRQVDRASSGRWFDGWKRNASASREIVERAAHATSPPVARPRLWLLTAGWRRHGLIDFSDVPG